MLILLPSAGGVVELRDASAGCADTFATAEQPLPFHSGACKKQVVYTGLHP